MIPLKNVKWLIIGVIAGALLATSATAFAETSAITAYLRDGFTFKVNGKETELKNTPIVYQNTTYLPVREVARLMKHNVGYADNTITLDEIESPTPSPEPTPTPSPEPTIPSEDVDDMTIPETHVGVSPNVLSPKEIKARFLLETVVGKYPDKKESISLAQDGKFRFGEKTYALTRVETFYFDITPLIEDGVVTEADFQ